MPVYEYECESGHITTKFAVIAERNQTVHCKECLKKTKRIYSGHSVIDTKPKWLDDNVRMALGKPIKTRKEYDKHLKDNQIVCVG